MTTLLAIITGVGLFLLAIFKGGGAEAFVSVPSMMIVAGGTLAALFISFPLPRVMKVMGILVQIFKKDLQSPAWVIALLVRLSFKARQQSLLALEKEIENIDNRFIRLGLELVIDGHPGNLIKEVLETELDFLEMRHRGGENIFRTAGKFAPAFGMIGTLIGLVQMLQGLGDGGADLGKGMAIALITTFYGAMMTNLFFLPVAEKLRSRSNDEVLRTQIIIEGIVMLQAGMNPRIIERKLNSFLPPEQRASHYEAMLRRSRGGA